MRKLLAAAVLLSCTQEYGSNAIDVTRKDCISCHRSHYESASSPPHVGVMPPTCGDCHTTSHWRPALSGAHPEDAFPISTGAHADIRCQDCHDVEAGESAGGANTDCVQCHPDDATTPLHEVVTTYRYEADEPNFCLTCHPRGTADVVDHDPYFPIETGTNHENVDCGTCHVDPRDRRNFSCLDGSCHPRGEVDPDHGGVSGYAYESASCYSCHPRGTADGAVNHDRYFPIETGTNHGGVTCSTCHIDPQDRGQFSCLDGSCHAQGQTEPGHGGVAGYDYSSASCYSCHPRGVVEGSADHSTFFPLDTVTNHDNQLCATCHPDSRDRKQFTCFGGTCHPRTDTDPPHGGVSGYDYDSASCLSCHPNGLAEGAVDHAEFFPIDTGSDHGDLSCATCHPDSRDRKQFTCFSGTCHPRAGTDANHAGVGGYAYDSTSCYSCHPNGLAAGAVDHTAFFPIALTETHGDIACGTCHADPAEHTNVTCASTTCHGSATTSTQHVPVGGYSWSSPLCMRCHAESQVDRVSTHMPFQIGNEFAHYRESCLVCHDAMRTDKTWAADFEPFKCFQSCHAPVEMADKHKEMPEYRPEPRTCVLSGCHQNGTVPD